MIIYNSLFPQVQNGLAARLRSMLPTLAAYGFNGLLWPPLTQNGSGGEKSQSLGYDKRYDLHVGQWDSLRWGSAQDVQATNLEAHRNGMMVLEDSVIHQYSGAGAQTYNELGAEGQPDSTLFPKRPSCFVHPETPRDTLFDADGDQPYGDQVTYQHCKPAGYMLKGIIQATQWRRNRLGMDGMRVDMAKNEASAIVKQYAAAVGGWNFCETFVGDKGELGSFISQTGQRVLDFPFHWAVQHICDHGWSLRSFPGSSLCEMNASKSVLFVDTADTDQSNDENVKFNKLWAYLLALTMPAAAALVYAGDYERYGLAKPIDNLAWIATTFAIGALTWQHVDDTALVWSRDGDGGSLGWSGGLLCAFSTQPVEQRSVWTPTTFASGTHLHDYTGHGPDLWVDDDGWVELQLGPNVNGTAANYVCYAPAGVNYKIPIHARPEGIRGSLYDFSDITVRFTA